MSESDGAGAWKWLVGILSSMMLTGLAAWYSFGGGINAQEARTIMDREYERPIAAKLATIERDLERVHAEQKATSEKVAKQHEETQEKLNQIIRQLPRPER